LLFAFGERSDVLFLGVLRGLRFALGKRAATGVRVQ
jgi:hypothetical protein